MVRKAEWEREVQEIKAWAEKRGDKIAVLPPEPSLSRQLSEFVARHWILAVLSVLSFLAGVAAAFELFSK